MFHRSIGGCCNGCYILSNYTTWYSYGYRCGVGVLLLLCCCGSCVTCQAPTSISYLLDRPLCILVCICRDRQHYYTSIFSTSYSSSSSTLMAGGGLFIYSSKGLLAAFRSRSGENTRYIFINSGRSTLYKFLIFSRIR